jgi:hypothetical protein
MTDATPTEAVESLLRAAHGEQTSYLEYAAVSKDGSAVIVKMTPEQALQFVDMIYEEED